VMQREKGERYAVHIGEQPDLLELGKKKSKGEEGQLSRPRKPDL